MHSSTESNKPKIVIYTVILGHYDRLLPTPDLAGVDFIAFCDEIEHSRHWKVEKIQPVFQDDPARSSRWHKILPHRSLSNYDISIYVDGNILVKGELQSLIDQHLGKHLMAAFDHSYTHDPKQCIYQEFSAIESIRLNTQKVLDDPEILEKQYKFLKDEGYPEQNGMNNGGVLIRRHNDPKLIEAMELWWYMVTHFSKRDQLSLNYALWKSDLDIVSLPYDIRRGNPWFYHIGGHNDDVWFRLLKYRIKRWLKKV